MGDVELARRGGEATQPLGRLEGAKAGKRGKLHDS
jgi:hypothetical protein